MDSARQKLMACMLQGWKWIESLFSVFDARYMNQWASATHISMCILWSTTRRHLPTLLSKGADLEFASDADTECARNIMTKEMAGSLCSLR